MIETLKGVDDHIGSKFRQDEGNFRNYLKHQDLSIVVLLCLSCDIL